MKKFIFFWFFFIIATISAIVYLYMTQIDYINETFRTFQVNTSHESGFYEEEFLLELTTPRKNATIYYTIDGSNPNPANVDGNNDYYYYQDEFQKEPEKIYYKTYVYQEPLLINQTLVKDNSLHKKRTADREIPQIDNLFKSIVIKAIGIDENNNQTDIKINNYFVDENIKDKFRLPIITIITEPHNLMDYYEGIYVPGKIFDDEYDEEEQVWRIPANYRQRGFDWEKDAIFHYYVENNLEIEQNIGVRIHGGATRSYLQKSLRLYARNVYDAKNYFQYDFFEGRAINVYDENIDNFKRLILRNGGNNDWRNTMFRDIFMQDLVKDLSFDTQAAQPSIVFFNGEYWGIHNIRERYDKHYLENVYKVNSEEVIILENRSRLDTGIEGDEELYITFLNYVRENNMSDNHHYRFVKEQMDVNNYVDYFISNIFFNNGDWPHNNNLYWRKRENLNDKIPGHDGKWRWLLFDTDFGFNLFKREVDLSEQNNLWRVLGLNDETVELHWSSVLINNLLQNENFENKFISNFALYLNTIFKEELVLERIDYFKDLLEHDMKMHTERWQRFDMEGWHENIEIMREFAENRPHYQREHLIEYFDLEGLVNIEFVDKKNNMMINDFKFADSYDGEYFKNIPLVLSMAYNHNFSHWEDQNGNILSEESEFTFVPEKDDTIIAVYDDYNLVYIIIFSISIILFSSVIVYFVIKYFQKIDEETDTSYQKKIIH